METVNCWLCDSTAQLLKEVATPQYYHCAHCDLIFIDQRYILEPAEEKKRYLLHNNSCENKGYVQYLRNFIATAVHPFITDIQRGLDFGCGPNPVLSQLLREQGIAMDYYDPFFHPRPVFAGRRYDLITCTEVLEHVRHPRTVLELLSEHLQARGILSIMTQFHHQQPFSTWWYRQDKTHICFFSPKSFRWIAKHFNLKIVHCNDKNICVLSKQC